MDLTLRRRVESWIEGDPDAATRDELRALLDAQDEDELADRFDGRLAFGTAGIRGPVAAGPNRLNLAVVRQTAWGIGQHQLERHGDGALVVVGHDARPDSPRFAAEAAGVLAALGIEVRRFTEPVPTPIVAWLARRLAATAAVVVTASHNPPQDNGIKVYDERAVQIVPPTDEQIAAAIDRAPLASTIDVTVDDASTVGDEVEREYRADVVQRIAHGSVVGDLTVVATAMHGVGAGPLERLLADAGLDVHHVPQQREPDGTFPTVAFPNPEEPGALDLALDLAVELDADLVIANDPDADRLAVAVPGPDGGWRALTGNEVGALLGDAILAGRTSGSSDGTARPVVASSIVSSPQLTEIAEHHGAEHRWTLTGFKWIWTALLAAEHDGLDPVFGYEEALGYSVHPGVRDKDGLSAALALVQLAGAEVAAGRTLLDRLDDLARRHGVWASAQVSARLDGDDADERMARALGVLRRELPAQVGGLPVTAVTDYLEGAAGRPPWLGAQNLLELSLGDPAAGTRGRVLARPSGTEPKLKVYADLRTPATDGGLDDEREQLAARAGELAASVLRAAGLG